MLACYVICDRGSRRGPVPEFVVRTEGSSGTPDMSDNMFMLCVNVIVVVGGEIVPEVRLLGPKGSQHPRMARHG